MEISDLGIFMAKTRPSSQ